MTILALDPSINHLGWAVMQEDRCPLYGTIQAPPMQQASTVERIDWIITNLDDQMLGMGRMLETIIIEQPEPWGAYKSMASSRSGSMQMLTLVVGALSWWAIRAVGVDNVRLVKVSQWKGQLPKRITKQRMEAKYNCVFKTTDEADAVGLGDWWIIKGQLIE